MKGRQPLQLHDEHSAAAPVQQQARSPQLPGSPGWAVQAQSAYGNSFVQAMLDGGEGALQADGELSGDAHAVAAGGVSGGGAALPHGEAIQASFGSHDVSGIEAHVGGAAAEASAALGASAYATGDQVAFESAPDLHTAAHEAAHVVQQRAGVSLEGGLGQSGDRYEQHADEVADAVVQGKSAEGILDRMAGPASAGGEGLQRQAVQLEEDAGVTPQYDASEFSGDKEKLKILEESITTALSMVSKVVGRAKLGDASYKLWMDNGAEADTSSAAVKARVAHVKSGFDKIKKCLEKDKVIFKDWDEEDRSDYEDTYAYVYSGQKQNDIYLGGAFWVAANEGIDSRAGTIIHELSHHLHDTEDHHYGEENSKESAKNTPEKATTNADNYEHFSESV